MAQAQGHLTADSFSGSVKFRRRRLRSRPEVEEKAEEAATPETEAKKPGRLGWVRDRLVVVVVDLRQLGGRPEEEQEAEEGQVAAAAAAAVVVGWGFRLPAGVREKGSDHSNDL